MMLQRTQLQKELIFNKFLCFVLFCVIYNGVVRKVNAINFSDKKYNFKTIDTANRGSTHKNVDSFPSRSYEDFSTYSLIYPQIFDGYNKSLLQSTLDLEKGQHISNIILTYYHNHHPVHIDLKLNNELLPDQHFLRFQNSNSNLKYTIKNFTKTEQELCHYQGSIRGKPGSRAAVSTCNGEINGFVIDSTDAYIIHAEKNETLKSQHFLFRASDLRNKNASCGHSAEDNIFMPSLGRHKRSSDDIKLLHGPYKSNKDSLYVELVIVVDNGVYRFFEEHMGKVHQYCKDLANIMSALYSSLNVFVILTGVVVWNERDEIAFDGESRETLHNFLEYRSKKLSPEHPNDHAQLLTKIKFNDNIVGKAFVGPMCTHDKSGAVCMVHSPVKAIVANTMAHEMGHTFGMGHDTSKCKCQDKKCIMSDTSSSYIPTQWSSCSIDSFHNALSRGIRYCLRNKPAIKFDSPICGNGFVEPGEECDCGLPDFCKSNCCNPKTCRLYENATCGSGECCDLNSCRLKTVGTACRVADSECDLTEFCNGISEYCPKDVHKHDTAKCANGAGYCYKGQCGSHENHCRILWGAAAMNMEHCYSVANKRGDHAGNCGFNLLTNKIIKCEEEHVKCGKLQCSYPPNWQKFGIVSGAQTWMSYALHKRKYIECRAALFDFGLHNPDAGMTPNGAKCGKNKMCLDQKCIAIDKLFGKLCPENCNGNGVCNSEGNCHCDIGFAGNSCRAPGPGGSVDSGPATNPNSHDAFQRFLYIFFCGVIPFVILFYIFIYFHRKNLLCKHKKFVKNDIMPFSEVICAASTTSSLLSSSVNNIKAKRKLDIQREVKKSIERTTSVEPETPGTSSNSVDESNLPKVHKSIENLVKNLKNTYESKSASNYELSTLSSSTKTLPCPDRQVRTPITSKKSYKSVSTSAASVASSPNNFLKHKLEITDVCLQSSTNPLAVALSDGVALIGNSTSDTKLNNSKINKGFSDDMQT